MPKSVCFFANQYKKQRFCEQYILQDINILKDLGFSVNIASSFNEVPLGSDLYFSWWASGSILPLIKARLSNKKIIIVAGGNEAMLYRDSLSDEPLGYLATPWYKKIATRLTLKFGTAILVVSKFMVPDVVKLGAISPIVVYNSVNTNDFTLDPSVEREWVTSIFSLSESVVLNKRGEFFVRSIPHVLKEFPHQKFAVIGELSDAYERLQQLADDLGISRSLKFIGSISNSAVIKWMQASKVYVQISDTETFGVAVAEAMGCGTPVVVSKRGALPELVDNLGTYVNHNDPVSVAEGILLLLKKPKDEILELGTRSRQRIIENFSYEARRTMIKNIFHELGL